MATFVLIHGGCHGAWQWRFVADALSAAGHDSVAMDLPCDDPSADLLDYRDTVLAAIAHVEAPLVLVAHSMGGLTAPLVAATRPVRHMVMLAAAYPIIGTSFAGAQQTSPDMMQVDVGTTQRPSRIIDDEGCFRWTDDAQREAFYHDCSDEIATWAIGQLRRQSLRVSTQTTPLTSWPDCPLTYIACRDDRLVNNDWARQRTGALGGRYVEIAGGHSPFFSQVDALSRELLRCVDDGTA